MSEREPMPMHFPKSNIHDLKIYRHGFPPAHPELVEGRGNDEQKQENSEPISHSPEQHGHGGELHQAQEILGVILPAHQQSPFSTASKQSIVPPSNDAHSGLAGDRPGSCASSDACGVAKSDSPRR